MTVIPVSGTLISDTAICSRHSQVFVIRSELTFLGPLLKGGGGTGLWGSFGDQEIFIGESDQLSNVNTLPIRYVKGVRTDKEKLISQSYDFRLILDQLCTDRLNLGRFKATIFLVYGNRRNNFFSIFDALTSKQLRRPSDATTLDGRLSTTWTNTTQHTSDRKLDLMLLLLFFILFIWMIIAVVFLLLKVIFNSINYQFPWRSSKHAPSVFSRTQKHSTFWNAPDVSSFASRRGRRGELLLDSSHLPWNSLNRYAVLPIHHD